MPLRQRLFLPVQVIEKTLRAMQKYGRQGHECIAYWLGDCLNEDLVVNEVCIPKQYATATFSKVQESEVARLFSILEVDEKVLVAQLHTHPNLAFHSSLDEEYPVAFVKGLLSLVVPYYGFIDVNSFPKLTKVYVYNNEGSWNEVPFEKTFTVIPRQFRDEVFHRTKLLIKDCVQQELVHINQVANYRVAVVLSKALFKNTLKYLAMLITAINLLARLSFNIDVFVPETTVPEEFRKISIYKRKATNLIRTIYYSINPSGTIKVNSKKKDLYYDVALVIGAENESEINAKRKIFIDSSGWISLLWHQEDFRYNPSSEIKKYNPIPACVAVALGIAEVFKALLNDVYGLNVKFNKLLRLSLLDYQVSSSAYFELQLPEVIDIDSVYLIGAGSLGNAIMYTLALLSLKHKVHGTVYVIDPDVLEPSNLSRHVLATIADVNNFKVNVISRRAKMPSLKVVGVHGRYQDLTLSDRKNMDIAMVAVDNVKTRWDVQRDLPRVLLHGAVYSNSILVSKHDDIANKGCLGCIYWKDTAKVNESRAYPAAPYALLFAGVVMVAELLKERIPQLRQYALNNVLEVPNLLIPLKHDVSWFHRVLKKADNCGCNCKDRRFINRYLNKWLRGC